MNKTTIIFPIFSTGSLSRSFVSLLKITFRKFKELKLVIRLIELLTWILRYVVMGTTRKQYKKFIQPPLQLKQSYCTRTFKIKYIYICHVNDHFNISNVTYLLTLATFCQ